MNLQLSSVARWTLTSRTALAASTAACLRLRRASRGDWSTGVVLSAHVVY